MASISGTSSLGNTSLRGFGGMASGIDRDEMIEQMTLGTTTKIANQKKEITSIGWKQEAYRNITDKILDLQDNYFSYASGNNLKDPDFFGKNLVSALGDSKVTKYVTATGSSNMLDYIALKAVNQLATAATLTSGAKQTAGAIPSSVEENIDFFRGFDGAQVREAAQYAQAEAFIREKEGEMDARIAVRGNNLSGGQKQRIMIARALAAKPKILILDDASSALDYKTDARLRKELGKHFRNTTTINIAQRISSIQGADHILVLEDGRCIGYGTHGELLQNCAAYQMIYELQMGQREEASGDER